VGIKDLLMWYVGGLRFDIVFIRIIQNKKVRIILLSLLILVVFRLIWVDDRERAKVVQAFTSFVENKDFTSVEFDLHANGRSLEKQVMSPRMTEEIWTIIKNAKPGSGPKRVYDIHFIIHFSRTDGTTVTVRLRKDVDSDHVRMVFYLTGKAGYSLIGEDRHDIIDEIVAEFVDLEAKL
jgi:hypothetical protein